MRIALVTIGEPLPIQVGEHDRPLRTGYLAQRLATRGHDVTWWTSVFDHARKKRIVVDSRTIQVRERLTLRLLSGGGYKNNVSLARLLDQRRLSQQFAAAVRQEPPPDVVVCSLPPVELSLAAVEFGLERDVPIVLDMRDMWPDIFVDVFPKGTRTAARLLLAPFFRQAERACHGATAITGITTPFVDWGLTRGNRRRSSIDRAFPMGYEARTLPEERLREAESSWKQHGVSRENGRPIICFFGNLGRMFDLEPVIQAAAILEKERGCSALFVLCGSGERLAEYQRMAANLPNVILPGWVDEARIQVLLRWSHSGIDPLPDRYDYLATINNKAIEYLSAGVPILSSPAKGLLAETIATENCGASCASSSPRAFADLVEAACQDPAAWAVKATNARGFFEREFKASTVYDAFSELLELIGRHGAATSPRPPDT